MKILNKHNIPDDKVRDIIDMIYLEKKNITRSFYRDQIAPYGIVIFTSRTSARIFFCEEEEMYIAEKNTKFYRLPYVTFSVD